MLDDVQWICFHGIFDFAYLLRLLTGEPYLPVDEYAFQEALKIYFPCIYDIKTLAGPFSHLQGSLAKLCQELGIKRVGIQHQAGSDSLVTAAAFFKLKEKFYSDGKTGLIDVKNVLYGLNTGEGTAYDKFGYAEQYHEQMQWYQPACIAPMYPTQKWMEQNETEKGKTVGRGMNVCVGTEAN